MSDLYDNENNTLNRFCRRLEKIGISVELAGNYPWIYLDKVNDIKVKGNYQANHGFTAFWSGVELNSKVVFSDRKVVFNKIRETLSI